MKVKQEELFAKIKSQQKVKLHTILQQISVKSDKAEVDVNQQIVQTLKKEYGVDCFNIILKYSQNLTAFQNQMPKSSQLTSGKAGDSQIQKVPVLADVEMLSFQVMNLSGQDHIKFLLLCVDYEVFEDRYQNSLKQTPLMAAVQLQKIEYVNALLPYFACLRDSKGVTALMRSAASSSLDITKLLLCEAKLQDETGRSALYYMLLHGKMKIADALLHHEGELLDVLQNNILHLFVCMKLQDNSQERIDFLKTLLKNFPQQVLCKNCKDFTPLMYSISRDKKVFRPILETHLEKISSQDMTKIRSKSLLDAVDQPQKRLSSQRNMRQKYLYTK